MMQQTQEPPISAATRRLWRPLSLLLVATALIHLPALFHAFFIDDYVYVERVAGLDLHRFVNLFRSSTLDQSASGAWWAPRGTLPFYRPIAQVTFAADYLLWGLSSFGFHLTNLLLHLACTVLTWRLALILFVRPGHALAVAAVFAIQPVHLEAVIWVSGRFDLLVCACMIASVLSYLRWSNDPAAGWGWAALCVLLFTVGLGCKETALILPAALVALELLGGHRRAGWFRRLSGVLVACGIVSLCYLACRVALFGGIFGHLPPPYGLDTTSPLIALRSIAWNSAQYLLDLVLCIHIEPAFLPRFWCDHPVLFAAVLTVATLLLITAMIVGRSRVSWLGLVWLVLFTAPSLLSMPGERNVYLPSVGLALLIGAVCHALDAAPAPSAGREVSTFTHRPLRRASFAVLGVWIVICLIQQTLMGFVTAAGEKVYRDLETLLPDPPRDARIYVVHQNPINSVGFAQALRLRYGRPDLSGCALSLSPSIITSVTDEVVVTGPDSIRLVREGGTFFSSFIERFHRFSQPASGLADACRSCELELLNPPSTYDSIAALEFRLPRPVGDPRTRIFYWDNSGISSHLDLLRQGRARLRRCEPTLQEH